MGISIHPEGDTDTENPYVKIRYVEEGKEGVEENLLIELKQEEKGILTMQLWLKWVRLVLFRQAMDHLWVKQLQ